MKTSLFVCIVLLSVIATSCSQQGSTPWSQQGLTPPSPTESAAASVGHLAEASSALSATIDFGRDNLGSPFPPPSGHDQSGHSRDSLFPAEVVIDKGGRVTFIMGASGVHEVAIYQPGTKPDDINATLLDAAAATCPPVPTINDPHNRVTILSDQVCEGGSPNPSYTFTEPGRYLVICTFLPHFQSGMYGWVTVRDR
jgi:plastocyanin